MRVPNVLKNPKTYLIAGGVAVAAGVAWWALGSSAVAQGSTQLRLSCGANGSTDPPSGMYDFKASDYVTIKASPATGYSVSEWRVDGNSSKVGTAKELTLSMSQTHDVVVTFTTGTPISNVPYAIKGPLTVISLMQPYSGQFYNRVWYNKPVASYDEYEGLEYVPAEIVVTVVDRWNQPCANISLTVYTDSSADYQECQLTLMDNPLHVTTGADGTATITALYHAVTPSDFGRKHLFYHWRSGFTGLWGYDRCLPDGTNSAAPWPSNWIIGEEVLLCDPQSWEARCGLSGRDCSINYEYKTVPLSKILHIEYAQNPLVSTDVQLQCWIGFKAPPVDHIHNGGTPSTPETVTLTVLAPSAGGEVMVTMGTEQGRAGTYALPKGSTVTFTASSLPGYRFYYWIENDVVGTQLNPLTRTINQDWKIQPLFILIP